MAKAFLFKDKDGDYVVANAPAISEGVQGWQIGAAIDDDGGAVAWLNSRHPVEQLLTLGTFGPDAPEEAKGLGTALVGEVEINFAPWDDDDADDFEEELAADTDGE